MKVRFNEQTLGRLAAIEAYIAKDSPSAAMRVAAKIVETILNLEQFPLLGRPGRVEGRRQLRVPGLPYIIHSLSLRPQF